MSKAAGNAPLFLEAFFHACQSIHGDHPDWGVPELEDINRICNENNTGYTIDEGDPALVRSTSETAPAVEVEHEATILETADEQFREALERSDELLNQGQGREAVQNLLWVLASMVTAVDGHVV